MKKFILGFITGGIICAAVTGIAVEYAVTANPYPVKVDGQAAAIEGYNINDSTYFKLRDVSDAVGGFSVDFKDDTIVINTVQSTPTPTSVPTAKPNLSPLPEVEIETWDGAEYVRKSNIIKMLDSIGLTNYDFSSTSFYNEDDRRKGIFLLEDMPHHPTNNELIPIDYYNNTVVPVINSLR